MLWSCSEKSDQEVSLALRTPFFSRSVCVRREARVCGGRCSAAAGRMDRDGSWSLGGHYTRGRGGDVSFIYEFLRLHTEPSVWLISLVCNQAVRRIVQRDGVSQEEAGRRLQSQWSNVQLVEQANVVLCTLWEPDVTQKQVQSSKKNSESQPMSFLWV